MRDECPYCGNPLPLDRSRSCGELECRRAIKSGYTARPRRQPAPSLAEIVPAPDLRWLRGLLAHQFNVRTW